MSWGKLEQKFEAFEVKGRTALRAINGKFVSAGAGGQMRADAEDIGSDELFVPSVHDGTVTLQTKGGGMLGGEGVTMDEDVRAGIAKTAVKVDVPPPARVKPVNTFVSRPAPEAPALAPARLIPLPAVVSLGAMPPKKLISIPKPQPGVTPDLDLGTYESLCGEPATHRLMIPIANAADRAAAKVRLEQEVETCKLSGVASTAGHLAVSITADYRVSGTYPVKVIVEFNGKTLTGKANVVIKHNKPQPYGLSAVVGGQSEDTIPFLGELTKASTFTARFEPQKKEFRLTNSKGTMAAGAKFFPFRVVFMPKDSRPIVTLLVVVFDHAEEYTVEITGSAAGFIGRQWKGRQKMMSSDIA